MQTTRKMKYFSKIAFVLSLFFTSCCFADSWQKIFMFNINFRALKIILCFVLPFIFTFLVCIITKDTAFVAKASSVIMALCILLFFADKFTINIIARIGNDKIIFHFMYSLISIFTVLATVWLWQTCFKISSGFEQFTKTFFLGYLPLSILLFILFFFAFRVSGKPDIVTNFVPFKGEIGRLFYLKQTGALTPNVLLHSLGNVFYFSSISVMICCLIKKRKVLFATIIPIMLSVFIEYFQHLTLCGDTDIDDVLLNTLGALLGVCVYLIFFKQLIKKQQKG